MVLVIGNTPKRVELTDLNDCVYYKQQKVFTEAQYEKSLDLRRAIEKGSLSVLKRIEEKTGSFDGSSIAISPVTVSQQPVADTSKIDALLERINSLEKVLAAAKTPTEKQDNQSTLNVLLERIDRLERETSGTGNEQVLTSLFNAVRSLEERIGQNNSNDAILSKLEEIISRAPKAALEPVERAPDLRPEEVYVPNITVEDANTHIKLNVRTIESGDSVSDSLKKLKELKSKSK
jgi:hypothetical protein